MMLERFAPHGMSLLRIMAGLMAFAYVIAHAPRSFWPTGHGGDAAVLFCFLFLYLVFAGPRPWRRAARKRG